MHAKFYELRMYSLTFLPIFKYSDPATLRSYQAHLPLSMLPLLIFIALPTHPLLISPKVNTWYQHPWLQRGSPPEIAHLTAINDCTRLSSVCSIYAEPSPSLTSLMKWLLVVLPPMPGWPVYLGVRMIVLLFYDLHSSNSDGRWFMTIELVLAIRSGCLSLVWNTDRSLRRSWSRSQIGRLFYSECAF